MRTGWRGAMFAVLVLLAPVGARAQEEPLAAARAWREKNGHRIVGELVEFLSLPNVATNPADIQRNAEWLKARMERSGIETEIVPIAGGRPVVYGELRAQGAKRTLLFYCHYDGQAVDPTRWNNSQPFKPALRTGAPGDWSTIPFPAPGQAFKDDWRIYARSASDDKSPIIALLAALDALRAQGREPTVNLKFVFDGEEEQGSPNLHEFIARHRERLKADAMIIGDGPVHPTGRPTIFFGNRGIMTLDLTVYGPRVPLHSGHYGNWAPNPAMRLAQLLATMKDAAGRVTVEGFYDDVVPLSETERAAIAAIPNLDAELKERYGFSEPEGGGQRLDEMIQLPSFNVRGLESAYVGDSARTIVPATSTAAVDVRLVMGTDHQRMFERIVAHIRRQGWHVTENEPTDAERQAHGRIVRVVKREGYNAVRTPMDVPVAKVITTAVQRASAEPVVLLPTLGGSGPSYLFADLGIPIVGVPIVNFDNNQHSENENLRLGNFWRGFDTFVSLLLAQ